MNENVESSLYTNPSQDTLFHYTSINSLLNIVKYKSLWASEIRYFSDASEMGYTNMLFQNLINQKLGNDINENKRRMYIQLQKWLEDRINNGHLLFILSFTTNGNQLSQWRSYCLNGKGVSIGFEPNMLKERANQQSFCLGKCIYDNSQQEQLINKLIVDIENLAESNRDNTDLSKRHASNSFHDIFESVEDRILKIAALIKHPAFKEEQEWRLVSNTITNYIKTPMKYREGTSFIIPYLEFKLSEKEDKIDIEQVYLGPTANQNIAMKSLTMFLSKHHASPQKGVCNSCIPYRTW